jgi:predicted enzyme related to lactoylglutathione lyase
MHGQFVWYDLSTSDVAGALRFYPGLFGWKTQKFEFGDPSNPYTMWTAGGETFGGVMKLSADQAGMGIPPNWLCSVEVNSVDSTAQQAKSLGGQVVVGPMDIPNTGRYAVLLDPQGGAVAIYQPNPGRSPRGFDGNGQLGRASWHELMTTDVDAAWNFYGKLFMWEKTGDMDAPGVGKYQMFGQNGAPYGGIYKKPAPMAQVPTNWLPYFFVKDAVAATNAATKAGAKVMQPPMDIPGGGSIAVLTDPQGAHFAVHSASELAKGKPKPGKSKPGKSKGGKSKTGTVKAAKKGNAKKGASATMTKKDKKKAKKAAKKAKKAAKKAKKAAKKSKPSKKGAKKKGRRR